MSSAHATAGDPMTVGVAVIHYQRYPRVLDVITAVRRQTHSPARVLVIDNASPDGSGRALRDALMDDPDVEVVLGDRNRGYGGAFNLARAHILTSDLDALLVLTHDAVLADNALEGLVGELRSRPDVGAVGPLLSLSEAPEVVWSAGGRVDPQLLRPRPLNTPAETAGWVDCEPHSVDWLDGAAVLYRSTALREVGPMDERFFLYYEDVDYCTCLREHGWVVECVPRARATQSVGSQSRYFAQRNYLLYVSRHGSPSQRRRALGVEARQFAEDMLRLCLGRSSRWWIGGFYMGARAGALRDYLLRRFGAPRDPGRI